MIPNIALVTLTSDVLRSEAPNEVPLVAMYADAPDEGKETSKGPLGFGVGVEASITLLLPFVMGFFKELLEGMAHDTAEGAAKEASKVVVEKFRALLETKHLNSSEARQQAVEAAALELAKAGLPSAKAETTANSIVDSVLANRGLIPVDA
jgi:hypothetical protein